jgi:hypothetical protein
VTCVALGLGDVGGSLTGPDAAGDGDGDTAPDVEGDTAPDGEALCTAGDGVADLADALGLACPVTGPSASDPVDDAAYTAAPRAAIPAMSTIGTTARRLPSGNGSRQLGQNPETGVVTYPQFRQRTGRRFRATACLAAFSMRDRF